MANDHIGPNLRISEVRDPAVLFERYNIEEIRRVERRVRGEIEQKKEELRQMVGERYRDLIDAADTIGEMRRCSETVVRSVQDMQHYCRLLKLGRAAGTDKRNRKQWQEKFYTMASQIKLLLEIPECIWSAMEASQYLQATQLYLLCCHLHVLLHLEAATAGHYNPVLARFPILVRQVATTGHFRSAILLDSRSLLRGRAVSDHAIAEALVSTMLLEDSSPRQALADFLLARKSSIHQLLNQPQHGAGIKAQVCSLVELLVTTLFQAYAVFYLPPEGGLRTGEGALSFGMLFSILENVTSTTPAAKGRKVFQEEVSAGGWFRYLPPSVTEFQPTLRTLAQPIQREQLRDTLQQWIHTCKEDICRGVGSLLVYVKSLKGLASIRDGVWDLLSSDSISQHWSTVCQLLLERPLAVWEDFLQQLFLQRLQAITKEESEAISVSSVQLFISTVKDLEGQTVSSSSVNNPGSGRGAQYEVDVASFLWLESPGDLLSNAGWVSVSQRGQQWQRSGLAMKTQALTPCVQNFCSVLDTKLKARLDDLQHYLPSQDTGRVCSIWSSDFLSSVWRFCLVSEVLSGLQRFCLVVRGSIWSSEVLSVLQGFCLVFGGSLWSSEVLSGLRRFYLVFRGSVWSSEVLCGFQRFCLVFGGSIWFSEVLSGLRRFCLVFGGSVWSSEVLSGLQRFCLAFIGSVWSSEVLSGLQTFCLVFGGSVWSSEVLSGLRRFYLVFRGSVWSSEVLCGFQRFCLVFGGSIWFSEVLSGLRRFCLVFGGSVWSSEVLSGLQRFCLAFRGSVWSSEVLSGLQTFCLVFGGSVWSLEFFWSSEVLSGLQRFYLVVRGSLWSSEVLSGLQRFCLVFRGSVWSLEVLCGLQRFYLVFGGSIWSSEVLSGLQRFYVVFRGSVWSSEVLSGFQRFCLVFRGSVWSLSFCLVFRGSIWSQRFYLVFGGSA
uniref:Conserved oligomeric Golgi complex subunit 1 n=1 Tax=Amphiprion percula TaxID=161767 RepID=A0A3P8S6L7_AMPPE